MIGNYARNETQYNYKVMNHKKLKYSISVFWVCVFPTARGIKCFLLSIILLGCSQNDRTNDTAEANDSTDNQLNIEQISSSGFLGRLLSSTSDSLNNEAIPCRESFEYIGRITDEKNKSYYIVNYILEIGFNCTRTTRIMIFTKNEEYQGNYYTQGFLPDQILDNQLYFSEVPAEFSFGDGIPERIEVFDMTFDFQPAD